MLTVSCLGSVGRSTTSRSRVLRLPEVMDRVGLRRSAIYQRMSEGRFPKSRSLGPKCAVWVEAEINDWIQSIALNSSRADP
ncbi:MAG: AlpA family transcriptional regulator [Sphingomonadales bacterium]|nr:AlpA family transcriptional regulator [Sphingomonadales bacterium]MBK6490619.1 AlpA family transcriptional regulator [Sphingomonadales bacterium]MBK6719425.1 AlpA family transcriptional regulator [Sphingomonadales bacterium]MBK7284098.1 AlpA family transcriptional regulator [Sphingomonadales bacterium]MBK8273331.1 AlpA family transcriptional regulator [Sphingomonadales bacterium]